MDGLFPRIPVRDGYRSAEASSIYVGWVQTVRLCGSPAQLVEQLVKARPGAIVVCNASPGLVYLGRRRPRSWSDVFQLWQLVALGRDPREAIVEFIGWAQARKGSERRLRRRKWRQKRRKHWSLGL